MVGYWSGGRYECGNRGPNSTVGQKKKPCGSCIPHRNQSHLEKPPRDLGVGCADDLSRSEGPFNEMVAEGVLPNPPDLKRALPKYDQGVVPVLACFHSLCPPSGLLVQDFLSSQSSPLALGILELQESQLLPDHL